MSGAPVSTEAHELELQGQSILPGFRRELGFPPRDWRNWSDGKGNKIDAPKWRGRTYYDFSRVVPLPVDKWGQPLVLGDFRIYLRTDRQFAVCDWSGRRKLGDETVYLTRNLKRAMQVCTWKHRWRAWQGPLRVGETRERAIFGAKGFPK